MCRLPAVSGVEGSVPRNGALLTMSGGEPSSIKQVTPCAVGAPGPSWLLW